MATKGQHRYHQQIQELLSLIRAQLTAAEIAEVHHLIDHGEPAEGLRALAWIIEEEKKQVPLSVKRSICGLTRGLIGDEHMPESFRGIIADEEKA